jgi:N-acetylated-alpha-linked acidic dipeptidase
VRGYVNELKKLDSDQRAQIEETNREIEEGAFAAAADPRKISIPPPHSPVPPHLNFAPLENGIDALTRSAQKYDAARAKASASNVQAVNAKLIESERRLTDAAGLPGRPWFRHMIYAPGFYTGYGVKTIPGVREAIEQKRWQEADEQIQRVGTILTKEADLLDEASAVLNR